MDDRRVRAALQEARLDYLLETNLQLPAQLQAWLDLLAASPRNLTALREPDEALQKHAIEPLLGWRQLIAADLPVPHGPLIDVGSGNGAPGLPIALSEPTRSAVLLDSRSGAARFLEHVVQALDTDRVSVCCARAEDAARGPLRERFAVAVTRAAAQPSAALELMLPFLQIGGIGALWTGQRSEAEAARCAQAAAALGAVLSPLEPAQDLHLLVVIKQSATDPRLPRSWNQIRRGPPTVPSLCGSV